MKRYNVNRFLAAKARHSTRRGKRQRLERRGLHGHSPRPQPDHDPGLQPRSTLYYDQHERIRAPEKVQEEDDEEKNTKKKVT